jgi:tRNA1(Val) A37 N6-methylase TrmN6
MPEDELQRWARFMVRMAAPRGKAMMVHKAEALDRVLGAFDQRFGAIRILPLHPRAGVPAHRVIVEGTKGSRAPLQLLSGLVLHADGNDFTPAAQAILKGGGGLSLGA